jgi:hypothetical protein
MNGQIDVFMFIYGIDFSKGPVEGGIELGFVRLLD